MCVDDASRTVYTGIMPDEKKGSEITISSWAMRSCLDETHGGPDTAMIEIFADYWTRIFEP